jgi:hypothetical protein
MESAMATYYENGGRRPPRRAFDLAHGLGWFSIALGVAEIVAPRALSRALGFRGGEHVVRGFGVREIATGIGILATRDPEPWIKGRLAGDAMDIAALSTGLSRNNRRRGWAGAALASVAAVTALDFACARMLGRGSRPTQALRDYSDRSGFPRPAEAMRGVAKDAARCAR